MYHHTLHLKEHISFLRDTGGDPVLSVYLPDNLAEMGWEDKKRPCLVICPGGAYRFCSEREAEPVAFHFLTEGYNVFVLRYSVAPVRYPAQLLEVAATLELICQNGEAWHCDTDRIALMGFSAGGHLAAHYTTCYDSDAVRAVVPNSHRVQASVLCYPVISADPAYTHTGSMENLLGYLPKAGEQADFFSCDKQVKASTPPAFLWHTAEDATVPVMNTLLYAQALSRFQIPVEVHIYPKGNHGLSTADGQTCGELPSSVARVGEWLTAAKKWLGTIL